TKLSGRQNNFRQASAGGRSFVLVHQLIDGRYILEPRISLGAALHEHVNKMSLLPGYKRLACKIRSDRKGPANHLPTLHCKVDIMTGLISLYDIEFGSEGILHEFGQVITGRRDAVGTALRGRGGVADIIHRFVGSIGAHVQEMVRGNWIADPSEFGPIELHFRLFSQLLEIERRIDG